MALFGGSDDSEKAIREGQQQYQQYMQQALQEMQAHETAGRGDISHSLAEALGYGEQYRQGGAAGLQAYLGSLGIGGAPAIQAARQAFQTSPGYQFALQQGVQGIQRGAAATGGIESGAEQKALQRYGTGMAQQEYGGWQGKLAGLAGMGQTAAAQAGQQQMQAGGQLAQLGYGYAGQLGGLYGQMGQSAAEAKMAEAQAKQQKRAGWMGLLGQGIGALGTIGGAIFGGPAGAAIGGAAGSALGGLVSGAGGAGGSSGAGADLTSIYGGMGQGGAYGSLTPYMPYPGVY